MSSPILAGPGLNPVASALPVRPEFVIWYCLVGPIDPPLHLGRTPEEAEERLFEVLLRFFSEEADPVSDDPVSDARAELARWKQGALLSGSAADELSAFLAWRLVCPLFPEEALDRWREVFPAPAGEDPLAAIVSRGLLSAGGAVRRSDESRPTRKGRGGR